MAYVICVKLCEIKGLRKEPKIFTQSLGRLGETSYLDEAYWNLVEYYHAQAA